MHKCLDYNDDWAVLLLLFDSRARRSAHLLQQSQLRNVWLWNELGSVGVWAQMQRTARHEERGPPVCTPVQPSDPRQN